MDERWVCLLGVCAIPLRLSLSMPKALLFSFIRVKAVVLVSSLKNTLMNELLR